MVVLSFKNDNEDRDLCSGWHERSNPQVLDIVAIILSQVEDHKLRFSKDIPHLPVDWHSY